MHIISTKKQSNYGILYVVATPIGNINDITYRAVEVLSNVYIIATEDTRHSKKIFNYFGIKTKQISYHKHNEVERRDYLIKLLLEGKDIAIVSDAGTPSISDPGDIIISEAHKKNIMVSPIPGVSSVIAAISSSGFASDDFKFIGFLPKKNSKKLDILKIKNNFSLVFFESPNRVINKLEELRQIYKKKKKILVAKEITKIYENINHLSLDDWFEYFSENNNERLKGEFVIIIPKEELTNKDVSDSKIESFIILLLKNNVSYNSTIKIVCNFYKLNKNKIYKEYINLAKK